MKWLDVTQYLRFELQPFSSEAGLLMMLCMHAGQEDTRRVPTQKRIEQKGLLSSLNSM